MQLHLPLLLLTFQIANVFSYSVVRNTADSNSDALWRMYRDLEPIDNDMEEKPYENARPNAFLEVYSLMLQHLADIQQMNQEQQELMYINSPPAAMPMPVIAEPPVVQKKNKPCYWSLVSCYRRKRSVVKQEKGDYKELGARNDDQ